MEITNFILVPRACAIAMVLSLALAAASAQPVQGVPVDVSGVDPAGGSAVTVEAQTLRITWPVGGGETGELALNLDATANRPLIERLGIGSRIVLERVHPVTLLTIGERDMRAPSGWVAFFDNPPLRAYRTVPAVLKKVNVRIRSTGSRTVVRVDEVTAGSFHGGIEITLTRNSPLIFVETVVSTDEEGRAILYDAGLVSPGPGGQTKPWADPQANSYSPLAPGPAWKSLAWLDQNGNVQRAPAELNRVAAPLQVRQRMLVAETAGGAVAAFPPPHQYFYPLDFANNLGFVWYGAARNPLMNGYGFGIRQPPEGDRIWVPWANAPPRTEQRLGVFYLAAASAEQAMEAVSRLTHGDRYKPLPGFRTFTSHYHIEHTLELTRARMLQDSSAIPPELVVPGFVKTFKARGVDIVHLGEFHVGGVPRLPASERLPLLKTLHEECARLSDDELLVLPGEEPNVHLGGHWMSFFPRPVYWVLNRAREQPFVEEIGGYGKVYHVGSAADVLELMRQENGLMWTAHARIKGSRGFPDAYWDAPFHRSDRFLGAAWKAMPADWSEPRLGRRVLDLLDDTANAGLRKYVLAEADLFRMEPDYESYAHMNINYLRLDALPRFRAGWQPVVDALRSGKFFASTGEVLIPAFSVAGRGSGDTIARAELGSAGTHPVTAEIEGTFPLAFAEIVSGDGRDVRRERIDLSDTECFATRRISHPIDLRGRRWVRLEVWDLARNGAFTQPVWIE